MRIHVSYTEILQRAWIRSNDLACEQCKKSGENKEGRGRGHFGLALVLCVCAVDALVERGCGRVYIYIYICSSRINVR